MASFKNLEYAWDGRVTSLLIDGYFHQSDVSQWFHDTDAEIY